MTFKELLNSVTFDEVAPCLLQIYPKAEGNLKWYKIHFDMLRLMTPKHHDDANSDVCHISMNKWQCRDCGLLHLAYFILWFCERTSRGRIQIFQTR